MAQREASLQNEQEQVRQQKALLKEAAATVEKERLEARDMLKVTLKLEITDISCSCATVTNHHGQNMLIRVHDPACI